MKKTITVLLVVVLMLSCIGTVSFAATEMTPIPQAPEASQMFVKMQTDASVRSDPSQRFWTYNYAKGLVCPACSTNNTLSLEHNTGGYFLNATAGAPGGWTTTTGRASAREIHFTTPGGTTQAYASSGYVMLHNEGFNYAAGQNLEFGMSFASGDDAGGLNNWDRVIPVLFTASADGTVTLDAWDQTLESGKGGTRTLDVSEWFKTGIWFDIKMLYDLDNDTYDIYINDRPLMLSLNGPADAKIGAVQIRAGAPKSNVALKGTNCYAMSDADAAQYKQAAWERAFNQTSASAEEPIYLFITEGGGTPDATFSDFFGEKDYILECAGTTNLKIGLEYTEKASYNYAVLTADDMTQYNYDNLCFTLIKEHEVDELDAKVSGSYIRAGGKSKDPVVYCALFTKEGDAEKLEKVKVVESNYGSYEAAFEFDGTEPNGAIPKIFVWGGIERLTPLTDVISLSAIEY